MLTEQTLGFSTPAGTAGRRRTALSAQFQSDLQRPCQESRAQQHRSHGGKPERVAQVSNPIGYAWPTLPYPAVVALASRIRGHAHVSVLLRFPGAAAGLGGSLVASTEPWPESIPLYFPWAACKPASWPSGKPACWLYSLPASRHDRDTPSLTSHGRLPMHHDVLLVHRLLEPSHG